MNIKVKVEDKFYEVEIEDLNTLPVIARIGDEIFEIWPDMDASPSDKPNRNQLHPAPTGMQTNSKDRVVPAPLPGIITEIFVQPGHKIEIGAPLLVIEAMKMKNTIRSGRDGTIALVHVNSGESVKHHQSLIEFVE